MTQDRVTGAAANQFGKDAAVKIAKLLGAKITSGRSNEVLYDGKRAVIKSAHLGNIYIGVTLKMLEQIDLIIAAFETLDGDYDLYTLKPDIFKDNIRIGLNERIGLVRKKVFLEEGTFLKNIKLE